MSTVLEIHSIIRWVIVIVGVLAIIKFAIGWAQKSKFTGADRGLSSAFTGLMDLQLLLGLIIIFWGGLVDGLGFPRVRLEHGFAMIIAVVVAHLSARWRKSGDTLRFRNTFLTILISLLIIFAGVAALPGGWTR
ncbi:MAG: hypothetical protein IPL28_10060 [Chloroflexi bacterium]|nr:hypothetical protein [Chloroflexota bacterium]MDA0242287.1 hypothetical protein [Chloroflexota bacterium]